MGRISIEKLFELQAVLERMSLRELCTAIPSEFGVPWSNVKRAVRSDRLTMTPKSIAKIIKRFAANNIEAEDIDDILRMLKLTTVAVSCSRQWHAILLAEQIFPEEPISNMIRLLPTRVLHAARRIMPTSRTRPEVHSKNFGDFIYLSLEMVSVTRRATPLYVALAPNEPVAFLSSLANKKHIQAVIQGIGYKEFTDPKLFGPDIGSLLQLVDRTWNSDVNKLNKAPEYAPRPLITKRGIDYTYKTYNEQYVDSILGPDPPLLTYLEVSSVQPFYDATILDKTVKMDMTIKSKDVAETLKMWVADKIISPQSELLLAFDKLKSNRVIINANVSQDE